MITKSAPETPDLSTIFQSIQTPYIVFAADPPAFTIIEENEAHARVGNVSRENVIGKPLLEAFPDVSEEFKNTGVSQLTESLKRVIASGKPESMPRFRYDLIDKKGKKSPKWWSVSHYPVFDKHGIVTAVYQDTRDITDAVLEDEERTRTVKRLSQVLQTNEKQLRFMANAMPQLVWVARSDGTTEYFNKRWYAYTGVAEDQSLGDAWTNLIHPQDRARAKKRWKHSIDTGEPYEIEYRLYHKESDSYRWNIARSLPDIDTEGDLYKWYGTCTDIHEQRHTTEVQQFFADVSKELSMTLDYEKMLKKITQLCVPRLADWCSFDMLVGTGFKQVSVAHSDKKKLSQAKEYRVQNPLRIDDPTGVPKVVRTGKTEYYPSITDELLEQYTDDPERLAFMKSFKMHSIIMVPIRVKDEVIGAISFVLADSGRHYDEVDKSTCEELAGRVSLAMTNSRLYAEAHNELIARKELENKLRLEQQKLETRVRERTEQLQETNQGLRHEILKRRKIERILEENSENLTRSNAELEDFAYVASHDLQEPLRKIQAFGDLLSSEYGDELGEGMEYIKRMKGAAERMSTLIEDLLAFSRVSSTKSPPVTIDLNDIVDDVLIDLESRIDDVGGRVRVNDLPQVKADPTHMRQLFQNLIGNGLKFHKSDTPPVVEVSANTDDAFVEIMVKDNGIGFDEKYLDRIFSVFQRLHGRDAYEGTGIGLAVCRKIAERYDGSITASSVKNKGAKFCVKLPITKETV